MGRSNRLAALESKIEYLMGEQQLKLADVAKAEKLVQQLPAMRERLSEIETLINACEIVIKSDHPEWTRDHLTPVIAFVHKIPVRLGRASKHALDILRLAEEPMGVREIAVAVLEREGITDIDADTITKVANTVGAGLRSARERGAVDRDSSWPAKWWAVRPQ